MEKHRKTDKYGTPIKFSDCEVLQSVSRIWTSLTNGGLFLDSRPAASKL